MSVGPGQPNLQNIAVVITAQLEARTTERMDTSNVGRRSLQRMKALDFSSEKVFVKYVDPQRPVPEEIVLQVKAASLNMIRGCNSESKIVVTDVVGTVQTEKGSFKSGSWVTALMPVDREAQLPEFLPVPICNVARLPDSIDSFDVILTVQAAVRGYIALAILASATPGQTVLILDGANADNFVLLQLALHSGCTVFTTVQNLQEEQLLQALDKVKVANVGVAGWKSLERFVCDETRDLGADIIIDTGVRQNGEESETEATSWKPEKYELINSLAPGGRWITTESALQLDPIESSALFGKCASVAFLNHHAWLLSNYRQGVFLQILDEVVKKIEKKVFKMPSYDIVSLKEIEVGQPLPNLYDLTKCHLLKMS